MSNTLKAILIVTMALGMSCMSSGGGDAELGGNSWFYMNLPKNGTITYPAPGFETREIGTRSGSSCITREPDFPIFWGYRERGDRSVEAAAKMAGITKIKSVSHTYRSVPLLLGISGITQICTNVTGE